MSKATLLDLKAYKAEVDRLYGLLEERRSAVAEAEGAARPGRVAFREIELDSELQALMNVEYSTHQEYGGQSVSGVNAELRQKARLISLAALAELVKAEYQGDLWGLYKEWTAKIPDSRMYSMLEKAFADEGLLKEGQDLTGEKRTWFTDALIAEAGLPRKMLPEVVELFAVYWKYFYPMDIRELFRLVKGGVEEQKRVRILPDEHERLRGIVDRCKEFPTAISAAISELSAMVEALSEREDLQPIDLVDRPERFEEVCGLNPAKVIRGSVALRGLAQRMSLAITPEKFRRIVLSLAPGTRVILPSGRSVDTEEAGDVPYFGRYRIGAATHLVMPNELLPPEDVNVYPDHHLSTLGNRVIYKAKDEFLPLEGDAESPIIPRELWIEGRTRGFLWFRNRPTDRAVRVGKQHLFPEEGLHWRPALRLHGGKLALELSGIRLYDPKLTQKEIEIVAGSASAHSDVWFPTDRNGLGSLSHALLPISDPAPGQIEVSLRNRRTSERLAVAGAEVSDAVPLPEVMLFGTRHPAAIPSAEAIVPFGERELMLLTRDELPAEKLASAAYEAVPDAPVGKYRAYKVTWKYADEPFDLNLGEGRAWRFDRPTDLHLEFTGQLAADPYFKLPTGPDRIFRTWEDLSLAIVPELVEGEDRRVDLALYANDIFVAERSVEATSRLAGLRPGNSAFTGYQLRRGFGLGETASGQYRLELRRAGATRSEFTWTVLPPLDVTDLPMEPYLEGEEVSFLVTSKVRCFPDDANRRRVVFGSVQVPNPSLGVGEFSSPDLTTLVPLERPRLNLSANFDPPVCGWRLYDDAGPVEDGGQFLKKTTIARDDMARYGLVIFASHGRHAGLMVGDQVVRHLEFYEGYAFCELADLIDKVTGRATKITPIVGDRRLATLTVTWTPRVFQFERSAEYILDNALRFSLSFEGPQGDTLRLVVKDPDGRALAREDLVCDGRMERREGMDIKIRESLSGLPSVTLHGLIPSIGPDHEFGRLEFFNQERDVDMKKILERLEKEPSNPEALWMRGELYRTKGLLDLSVKDYEKALAMGLRDSAKRKRAEETIAQQDWNLLQMEIQALANHFVPFCRKELHLEY